MGYDEWLAGYERTEITVYCANPSCTYAEGLVVDLERENGQSWITPEDCPACHSILNDNPTEEENNDGNES